MSSTSSHMDHAAPLAPARLGLVLNPHSLRNASSPEKTDRLVSAFEEMGRTAIIEDGTKLPETLQEWRTAGVDLLVISGGDGTYQRVVDEMLRVWDDGSLPRVLFMLGGTAGIVARETGSTDPFKAVTALRDILSDGRPIPTDSMRILKVGDRHTLSFGIGVFRQLSKEYVTYGRQIALSHSLLGARFLSSYLARGPFAREALQPCLCRIRLDDREFPSGHFIGLYASALQRIGLFRPLEGVACPDAAFKVVGVREEDSWRLLRILWQTRGGENDEALSGDLLLCATESLQIEPDGGTVEYMADGEYYTAAGPLSIRPGPALSVVQLGG